MYQGGQESPKPPVVYPESVFKYKISRQLLLGMVRFSSLRDFEEPRTGLLVQSIDYSKPWTGLLAQFKMVRF
jgi:hypothetical protein